MSENFKGFLIFIVCAAVIQANGMNPTFFYALAALFVHGWIIEKKEVERCSMKELRTAEELARLFHREYESLAPLFGYATRVDTREFNPESENGKLMIAVCEQVLKSTANQYPSEQVDSECVEEDGCPTENAVLKRFWREYNTGIQRLSHSEITDLEVKHGVFDKGQSYANAIMDKCGLPKEPES